MTCATVDFSAEDNSRKIHYISLLSIETNVAGFVILQKISLELLEPELIQARGQVSCYMLSCNVKTRYGYKHLQHIMHYSILSYFKRNMAGHDGR